MIAVVVTLVTLFSTVPSSAQPPYPCNPTTDGETYYEADTRIVWRCTYVPGIGWRWEPQGVFHSHGWSYYTGSSDCTWNESGFKPGGGGTSFGEVYSLRSRYSSPCDAIWNRPPGYLLARLNFWRWTGSTWALCRDSDYLTNHSAAWGMRVYWWFAQPPCGDGYYGTTAGSWAWNGGWHGGWGWSGYGCLGFCLSSVPSYAPDGISYPAMTPALALARPPRPEGLPLGLRVDFAFTRAG